MVPKDVHVDVKAAEYRIHAEEKRNALEVKRTLRSDILLLGGLLLPDIAKFLSAGQIGRSATSGTQTGGEQCGEVRQAAVGLIWLRASFLPLGLPLRVLAAAGDRRKRPVGCMP